MTKKITVSINVTNASEFSDLVSKFSKKARELEEIAHELEHFQFRGKVENELLSDDTNES